jgi:hypothetical protein
MNYPKHLFAVAALLAGAGGMIAQTSSGGTSTGSTSTGTSSTGDDHGSGKGKGNGGAAGQSGQDHGKAAPHTPNANSSDNAKAVQTVLQKFDANRDQFIAQRQALLDQLAAAKTEADRKAILDQLKSDQEAAKQQKEQLGKEIRDELRTLRQQRKAGGG